MFDTYQSAPKLLNLKQFIPAGLTLILGLIVSFAVFHQSNNYERARAHEIFELAALERVNAVEKRFDAELTIMKSIVGFSQESKTVGRSNFNNFVKTVTTGKQGHQAFEWIPRVPLSDRANYEQAARNEGFSDFQFKEKSPEGEMRRAGKRDEYFPVYYIEPYQGNEGALGFDLASNATRLAALDAARDSGRIVASGRINLVQLKENNAGFLFFAPVYRNGEFVTGIEQRRQNLHGFALGVIRISTLVSGFSEPQSAQTGSRITDFDIYAFDLEETQGKRLLYTHNSRARDGNAPVLSLDEARSGPMLERVFDVGGRQWAIVARPTDPSFAGAISAANWFILLFSLIITGLITTHLVLNLRRTRIFENLVLLRTAELQDRESFIHSVVDSVVDGIITIDTRGKVETYNSAATSIFGYEADEVIGHNVKMLMPESFSAEHDGYLRNYLDTSDAKIIGIGREVEGLRKNGSVFPMDLAVNEMQVAGKHMFTGIVRDITERKQAETMKREFVSTVSHELRTPLTSIMGSLGLIKSGTIGEIPENITEMLDIAYNNSDRLVRLINDILDVEKIEAGKMNFQMAPMELDTLLQQAIDANRGYGEAHGVQFVRAGGIQQALVSADHDRLMQVLTNLLSNAAKFSNPGSSVEIRLNSTDNGFRVTVTDHGMGIPEEFRQRIFSRFSQADSSDTRSKGGTGLGLSITRAIVEQHGGIIGFETKMGLGTEFYFELPKLKQTEISIEDQPEYAPVPRILVCEDEPDIANLIVMLLQQDGYKTDIARTALEAETLLRQSRYDAMTLDLGLPDKSGIKLLTDLRDKAETQNLPIIVVSANAKEEQEIFNGDAIGVVDWMEKPIDEERLYRNLRIALASSSTAKPRILHVEDDEDILNVVEAVVGDLAEITAARTLALAKQLLQQGRFDLVVLDLALPDGNGEDLLPRLNAKEGLSTPVIVFSAKEVSDHAVQNIRVALTKSRTSNEQLLHTIHSIIESNRETEAI